MGVKIEDIKPGDRIRGGWYVVDRVDKAYTTVRLEDGTSLLVRTDSIVEHVPAPREIKVGDRVTWWGLRAFSFKVLAIHGTEAWVDYPEKPIRLLANLEHVD